MRALFGCKQTHGQTKARRPRDQVEQGDGRQNYNHGVFYHGAGQKAFPWPLTARQWLTASGARRSLMTARKVGDHVELDKDEARAGQSGTGVRLVLIISTVLVLVGFAFVALFHGS